MQYDQHKYAVAQVETMQATVSGIKRTPTLQLQISCACRSGAAQLAAVIQHEPLTPLSRLLRCLAS